MLPKETIQNETKEKRGGFLSMLLGILGASLLGYILAGKGINRAGEGILGAGYGNKKRSKKNKTKRKKKKKIRLWKQNGFLTPPHSLTNFEIRKYYQNVPRFNGVYFRDDLQK